MTFDDATQAWLERFLTDQGAAAGTVHLVVGSDLHLAAAHNIPPALLERVAWVPEGKGMAGQAQVTKMPVQVCNLQDEPPGKINPMARLVGGTTAVALPVIDAAGAVRAVVGLSYTEEHDIDAVAEATLMSAAATLRIPV